MTRSHASTHELFPKGPFSGPLGCSLKQASGRTKLLSSTHFDKGVSSVAIFPMFIPPIYFFFFLFQFQHFAIYFFSTFLSFYNFCTFIIHFFFPSIMSSIPPPWLFPNLARNFARTRDEGGSFGWTYRFRVTLSEHPNARNAAFFGFYRINHGTWDPKKHPANIATSGGRRHKHFMHITIESQTSWGFVIKVQCKWTLRPTQMAAFILHEVNRQAVPKRLIQQGSWVGGKRSKRTGRVITAPTYIPPVYSPYAQFNVPYIHSIVLLPPQYGKYFGHTSLDAS